MDPTQCRSAGMDVGLRSLHGGTPSRPAKAGAVRPRPPSSRATCSRPRSEQSGCDLRVQAVRPRPPSSWATGRDLRAQGLTALCQGQGSRAATSEFFKGYLRTSGLIAEIGTSGARTSAAVHRGRRSTYAGPRLSAREKVVVHRADGLRGGGDFRRSVRRRSTVHVGVFQGSGYHNLGRSTQRAGRYALVGCKPLQGAPFRRRGH